MEHVQLDCVLSDWLMEQGKEPIKVPDLQSFLFLTNGRAARKRLFTKADHDMFLVTCRLAANAAMSQEPFYDWVHAGAVANRYGSTTTTAIWGVWSTPDQNIHVVVGRVTISGRRVPTISGRRVPNPYGGVWSYQKWFRSQQEAAA